MADVRERSEAEETPFTGGGHPFFRKPGLDALPPESLPPKKVLGSCNYWQLDEQLISNMQWTVTPTDQSVPVFKMPHAYVEGVVEKVIHEQDGDTHLWVTLDGSKFQFACEITPQNPLPAPTVGDHCGFYGIFRYDLQHGWPELHPVDKIDKL